MSDYKILSDNIINALKNDHSFVKAAKKTAVNIQDYEFAARLGDLEKTFHPNEINKDKVETTHDYIIDVNDKKILKFRARLEGLSLVAKELNTEMLDRKTSSFLSSLETLGQMRSNIIIKLFKRVRKLAGIKDESLHLKVDWDKGAVTIITKDEH